MKNEARRIAFGTQVGHKHVCNKVFYTVYAPTVRNFGGIPEKFGAFGMSHDALFGSYYV
jgi:hypothetical protein